MPGAAGPVLRSQEDSGKEELSRVARGDWGDRLQCGLGVGLTYLHKRCHFILYGCPSGGCASWVGLRCRAQRDRACARRQARGRGSFRAVREGMRWFACNACSGPVPLRPGCAGGRCELVQGLNWIGFDGEVSVGYRI